MTQSGSEMLGKQIRFFMCRDAGTGEEAKGFLTMVLPELGGREVRGSKRSQGRDFTPERRSTHIVGFRPLPQTSRAVLTGVMPRTMVLPEFGGREVGVSKRSQGRDLPPSAAARTSWAFAHYRGRAGLCKGQG